jgi:integrase
MMNTLREAVEQYVAMRRNLGFELREPALILRNFVTFAESENALHITVDLVLRWVKQPSKAQPATWASRLGVVRRFATWYRAMEPRTEVPPKGLLPYRYRRQSPYTYSDDEIKQILEATSQLPSKKGLRALVFSTFFGLLAVTGMRMSEALALDRGDVDLDEGVLTIRRTKFGKSRIVPVHASTRKTLKNYLEQRERILPIVATEAFFVSERGVRITGCAARYNFAKVSQKIGLRAPSKGHGRGPRLHDMRHRFAAKTLINWYRAGLDVEREIPKLSTYLGHRHVNDTYWYLEAVPELLKLATEQVSSMYDGGES